MQSHLMNDAQATPFDIADHDPIVKPLPKKPRLK
jgi:hypothetical protein